MDVKNAFPVQYLTYCHCRLADSLRLSIVCASHTNCWSICTFCNGWVD